MKGNEIIEDSGNWESQDVKRYKATIYINERGKVTST